MLTLFLTEYSRQTSDVERMERTEIGGDEFTRRLSSSSSLSAKNNTRFVRSRLDVSPVKLRSSTEART